VLRRVQKGGTKKLTEDKSNRNSEGISGKRGDESVEILITNEGDSC
jgi:hypothetical protein